jgi:hypothetical protein
VLCSYGEWYLLSSTYGAPVQANKGKEKKSKKKGKVERAERLEHWRHARGPVLQAKEALLE